MNKIIKRILSLLLVFGMFFTISSSVIYAKDISTLPANFEQLSKETKIKILKSLIKELKEKIKIQIKRKITETSKEIEKIRNNSIIGDEFDLNKITFETIINQYLKAIDKGIIENGSGNIGVEFNNFGAEKEDKDTGSFSDNIKYSSKADLKAKKIEVNFNNIISFNSEKTKNTPAVNMKNLPFDFQELVDDTKIYFKINTDIDKILSLSDDKNKQMVKAMIGNYIGKYFVLDIEKIPSISEEDKKNIVFGNIDEMKKQIQLFNKYNKQYNAFSLKSTGKTEKVNGINTTKFEVKAGETKNVIKFFQAIISEIQNQQLEKNTTYTSEQKEAVKKELAEMNSQIDTYFADSKNSKAIDNIIKENVDSAVYM